MLNKKSEFPALIDQDVDKLQKWLDKKGLAMGDITNAKTEIGQRLIHQLKHHQAGQQLIDQNESFLVQTGEIVSCQNTLKDLTGGLKRVVAEFSKAGGETWTGEERGAPWPFAWSN